MAPPWAFTISRAMARPRPALPVRLAREEILLPGPHFTAEQPGGDPIGWFIAYAPADDPKYVVGGNMDRVLQGASSAMYVVRDVFGAIYGQPDTSTATTTIAD